MPIKSKNRNKRSRQVRKYNSGGRKQQKRIPAHRLSGRGGRNSIPTSTTGFVGPNILSKPLKSISAFHINHDRSLADDNDAETVMALYKCLKQSEGFKDDKVWEEQPSISMLADYLFENIRTVIPKGFDWVFFQEAIYYYKPLQKLDGYFGMPLEWLPKLKRDNPDLHNITIGVLYYLAKECGLDLFSSKWEDYFIDNEDNHSDEELYSGSFFKIDVQRYIKNDMSDHHSGVCIHYKNEMQEFYGVYSKEDLEGMINKIKIVKGEVHDIVLWLKLGIAVINNPVDLNAFIIHYNNMSQWDGESLTIRDAIYFPWSFYDDVFCEGEEYRNNHFNEFGNTEPCLVGKLTTKQHELPSDPKPLENLIAFMNTGRELYFKYYDRKIQQFYDNRRSNQAI